MPQTIQTIHNGNWTEWSAIWSAMDFFWVVKLPRPKLHDTKFNCHFIRSILKSHDFIAFNFRFLVLVAGLLKKAEPETPLRLI